MSRRSRHEARRRLTRPPATETEAVPTRRHWHPPSAPSRPSISSRIPGERHERLRLGERHERSEPVERHERDRGNGYSRRGETAERRLPIEPIEQHDFGERREPVERHATVEHEPATLRVRLRAARRARTSRPAGKVALRRMPQARAESGTITRHAAYRHRINPVTVSITVSVSVAP